MNQSIFLTGGTGFVGRHIADQMIADGQEVIALVRDVQQAQRIERLSGVSLQEYDISRSECSCSIPQGSTLIHSAWGDVRDTSSLKHLEEHLPQHLRFLRRSIEQGVRKLVVTGSCYEYGAQYGPMKADGLTNPNTPYGIAKDTLHKSLRCLAAKLDFQLIWIRLFFLFGEGQDKGCIIPQFDAALKRGDEHFDMSHGEQLLDYLRVDIAAAQVCRISQLDGSGVYNVCSGRPISLRRFLEHRMHETGGSIRLNCGHYPYRPGDSLALWGADPFETPESAQ